MGQIKNIKLHIVTDIKGRNNIFTMPGGVTVKDVNPQEFVRAFAAHLKKSKLKVPEYVEIVKTSKAHELGPTDPDWFHVRGASRVPPPQRRCRSHPKDLRWCKEERNTAGTLLFVVVQRGEESSAISRGNQVDHERCEWRTIDCSHGETGYGSRRWADCAECCW